MASSKNGQSRGKMQNVKVAPFRKKDQQMEQQTEVPSFASIQPEEPEHKMEHKIKGFAHRFNHKETAASSFSALGNGLKNIHGASAIGYGNISNSIKNWGNVFTSHTLREKKRIIAVFVMVILTIAIVSLLLWNANAKNRPMKAYEIYFGGHDLGVVSDVAGVKSILEGIKEECRRDYQMDVVTDQTLETREVYIRPQNMSNLKDVEKAIRANIDVKVNAYAIVVDGKAIAAASTEEDAKWVLDEIMRPYQEAQKNRKVEDIRFQEKVELLTQAVDFNLIEGKEALYKKIVLGTDEEKPYEVQEGDSLWSIAKKFKIKLNDIRKANPEVAATDVIRPKMKLNLIVPQNLLSVQVTETAQYTEDMPYETVVREDKNLLKTQKKVIQQGKKGKREVVAKVTKVNGVETEREIISQTVKSKPVNQIMAKGSKALPANGTAAALGLPTRGRISSRFGVRWGRMHQGVDIAAPTGTPIYAANAGTVVSAGYRGGYGKCVEISHGNGTTTRYGHASKLLVKSGEKVSKGQLIALVGSTGNSTGPHVHFEVRKNGRAVNPLTNLK